ncbi:MAG: GTP-dependent dephospho-CoA kinase family protein [Desulfurococcales archaeon]|nr:GTP-dependent dephospho-CoA kinase family protein [Desulfurococcales archaeon]
MKCLNIPKGVRIDYAIPRGEIVTENIDGWIRDNLKDKKVISIGDVVTGSLIKNGVKPFVSVIDGRTRRNEFLHIDLMKELRGCKVLKTVNPKGKLSLEAMEVICKVLSSKDEGAECYTILVDGEEDMLALPALSCAPLNSVVLYGVPGVGIAAFFIDQLVRYMASIRILYLEPVECM